jgi:hypothetical protein
MKVILSVPNKGYSRNVSCALNFISTFLLDPMSEICSNLYGQIRSSVYSERLRHA